jgi:hypothetical protein
MVVMVSSKVSSRFSREGFRRPSDREDIVYQDRGQLGLPIILWALVGVGGLITVGFTYFFGLENARVHRVMVLAVAVIMNLGIITIGVLESPFAGAAQLRPEPLKLILERFETSELSTLR